MATQTVRYWYQYHFRITITGAYTAFEYRIEEFELPNRMETQKEPDYYNHYSYDCLSIGSAAKLAEERIDMALKIRREKAEEARQLEVLKPKLQELRVELDLPDISDEKALKILKLINQKQVENDDDNS